MTDKQIIINGVDVSGCDFLAKKDDYCSYSGVTYAYKGQCMCSDEEMCKEHPKCFYKKVLKQLKRKEQECEELKKAEKYDSRYSDLQAEIDCGEKIISQLKQTLTEIKEIVGIGLVDGLQPEEYSGFLKILQAQILQKISEVEDETTK